MTASLATVLAHQGGWDEILMVLGPILVFWLILRAARRQLLEATDDDTGRPRVPACYRRLTSVNPAQLLAVAAVFCALAHVVTREKRREGVPSGLVVRVVVAAVALPPLRGLQPVRAVAHHVRPGMLRAARRR